MINDADAVFITDASGARFVLADALGRTDRASLARDNGFRFLLPVGDVPKARWRYNGCSATRRAERCLTRCPTFGAAARSKALVESRRPTRPSAPGLHSPEPSATCPCCAEPG